MVQDNFDILMQTLVDYGNKQLYGDNDYSNVSYEYDERNGELILSWKTGEDSGGSCWGSDASFSAIDNKEYPFDMLNLLLLQINPNFLLKDYVVITSIIKSREHRTSEYYGNGTYYQQRTIEKEEFLNALASLNIPVTNKILCEINDNLTEQYIISSDKKMKFIK